MSQSNAPARQQRVKAIVRKLRHYPITISVTVITLAVSIPALMIPQWVRVLEQDPHAMLHGQWWRSVSPIFIQGSGLGQFFFNVLGIVLVGSAIERHYGWWRWLVVYVASGVTAILLTSLWFPLQTDSGSSAAVAGLIGALVVSMVPRGAVLSWPGMLYAVFFAVYLTVFALGGPVVAAIVGTIVIPVFLITRRRAGRHILRAGTVTVILLATAAMLIVGDAHGVGLTVGIVVSLLLRPAHTTAKGPLDAQVPVELK